MATKKYYIGEGSRNKLVKVIRAVDRMGKTGIPYKRRRGKIGRTVREQGGPLLVADAWYEIDAGSPESLTEGVAEVFSVSDDGTTESLGERTVWNPFRHKVMGALTVSKMSADDYLIVGYDLLEALWLIENSGARTVLHIPEDAMMPADIRWQDTVKCSEIVGT